MKNFESQYNRWLDGSLQGPEREAFEAMLDAEERSAAKEWPAVQSALKEATDEIRVPHPDFLNSQVLESIARAGRADLATRQPIRLGWLVWAGAVCLALAAALTAAFLPRDLGGNYSTTVVSAWTPGPGISAEAFSVPGDRSAVIWIDGAGYIPAKEKVQ